VLTFLLECAQFLKDGHFSIYMLLIVVIWGIWGVKAVYSGKYTSYDVAFGGTASVIVPVVDETSELFRDVLSRIARQNPHEIIVVINGAPNVVLAAVCDEAGVRHIYTPIASKRNAVKLGVEASTGDISVLVDSDTLWTEDTLSELMKPFSERKVGGVTTHQRILNPDRNILTRWADWLESIRSEYSMPAMSTQGTVGCLPGRTIAFRRSILEANMEKFMGEKFLGVFLEVSDDRTLTNYALIDGYKTVYQSTSVVYTDAPTDLRTFVKQQQRWSRGSQYNTLRMSKWMFRKSPMLATFYFSDILIPFLIVGCLLSWGVGLFMPKSMDLYGSLPFAASGGAGLILIIGMTILMTVLSVIVRYSRHFAKRASDIQWIPVFVLLNTFVLIPIRITGFFMCAKNSGWGTRSGGYVGESKISPGFFVPVAIGSVLLVASASLALIPGRLPL
jgi:hyaluronan synthase